MSTLLNILALLKTNSQTALIVVVGIASAFGGYWLTKEHYEAQIASEREQIALAVKQQKEDYEKRISTATSRLVLESRRADTARTERDDLLNRLRVANARADRTDTDSNSVDRAEYARCRRFLEEGAGLLAEGDDLARRIAREKDALSEIVK